jgi:hypothetical protein
MRFDQNAIWHHAVDLAFDCFYITHSFPNKQHNPLGRQVFGAASSLIELIRPGSRWIDDNNPTRVQNLLGQLARGLVTANGLGFVGDRARSILQKRIHILARLLAYVVGPVSDREEVVS